MNTNFEKILKQHKYCFLCKGDLEVKGKNWLQCKSCGYRNYINPLPTTTAILLNENDEILLIKRDVEPGKGSWDTPGGFIDIGENAEDGMTREIKEELGIDLKDFEYLGSYEDTYLFDGVDAVVIGFTYAGRLGGQEIKINSEASEYRFFKFEDLPMDNIAFKGVKEALGDFLKRQ